MELSGWEYAKSGLDECLTPADSQNLEWQPADVPGTVASELLRGQSISYDSVLPLDDDDFWYRGKFILQTDAPGARFNFILRGWLRLRKSGLTMS